MQTNVLVTRRRFVQGTFATAILFSAGEIAARAADNKEDEEEEVAPPSV